MSYTELEHGYQGLRNATRPTQFYVGSVSTSCYLFRDMLLVCDDEIIQ